MAENVNPTPPPLQILSLQNSQGKTDFLAFRPGTSDEAVINSIFQQRLRMILHFMQNGFMNMIMMI